MSRLDEFFDWLEDQDYWVNRSTVEDRFPEVEFEESTGLTLKKGDDGDWLVPKRDLRRLAKPVEDTTENNATR